MNSHPGWSFIKHLGQFDSRKKAAGRQKSHKYVPKKQQLIIRTDMNETYWQNGRFPNMTTVCVCTINLSVSIKSNQF